MKIFKYTTHNGVVYHSLCIKERRGGIKCAVYLWCHPRDDMDQKAKMAVVQETSKSFMNS
jgi:hypothetical protein